ncbi:B12-binding domain-containing radical SAM protein [Ethanoligenens harbinense]|uniref:Radical SAM domain protein n=1 Tax=Ethanoligenens harbinense (strain DSM 18485 / JCM 12961 / CGMCC 1.5033 / YUAN-3) TaxID=663278 RepID=E6U5I5_ETHHY|nr:B12-binding domain-containing radical SAM protein [Ethanoligenens harbinense]ADU25652.1 Radical SAM domain protein [Ethanoligenens harbinense YUAN-3]AVQ94828.1 B12-binding domain-containing radical SAM protein [Ethanoligenens harbinense YUAN-3]AYF37518.1 B12-binding domain-containing radical SAM protein [Ethanoligenens harbinense]AYF40239.1 B12-binding domain-containing radical SAM protein [Ethanoligenens harbinense]QCN91074.1 B12-binding domain-containing radical SAM protein [Ethanoligenen
MNILLVYPEYPVTYWGFQYALRFVAKKAAFPPLGLLTVAAMIPDETYHKKLVDMNVQRLRDADLRWADLVLISAMVVQRTSVKEVIARCKRLGVKTAAGGPLFTAEKDDYDDVDYLILGEGEITMPMFLADWEAGHAKHLYLPDRFPELSETPVPQWNLIHVKKYASMNIQYSRGCPFDCEFCDITSLYGRTPRTKNAEQVVAEMQALYETGWSNGVFFVDDNFIGNKKKLKEEILPAITEWMDAHGRPFQFITETSINIVDDEQLMNDMVRAGFHQVFIGIETPDEASLAECHKNQNKNRDLLACIRKIQRFGLEVQAGFIVGFDSDTSTIFDRMVKFIQASGITTAMVGLLNAPKGTKLYQRLVREGRMTEHFSGSNTDFSLNFVPKMDKNMLVQGYQKIISTIYSPKYYYARVKDFLTGYAPGGKSSEKICSANVRAFLRSVVRLGIFGKERRYYWNLLFWALRERPEMFPSAVRLSIYGFHFRKVFQLSLAKPQMQIS